MACRFKCTACGDCCTGAPGYVWVNQAEITAMAERLGMEVAAFEKKYVRQIGVRRSLVEYKNGDCVFFDNQTRKCKVYEQRPAAVPDLALLEFQPPQPRSMGRDLRGLSRQRQGQALPTGAHPGAGCHLQCVTPVGGFAIIWQSVAVSSSLPVGGRSMVQALFVSPRSRRRLAGTGRIWASLPPAL